MYKAFFKTCLRAGYLPFQYYVRDPKWSGDYDALKLNVGIRCANETKSQNLNNKQLLIPHEFTWSWKRLGNKDVYKILTFYLFLIKNIISRKTFYLK